jgi:hypothetical protein
MSDLEKEIHGRQSMGLKPVFRIRMHLILIRIQHFGRRNSPAYTQYTQRQQSRSSPKKGYDGDGFRYVIHVRAYPRRDMTATVLGMLSMSKLTQEGIFRGGLSRGVNLLAAVCEISPPTHNHSRGCLVPPPGRVGAGYSAKLSMGMGEGGGGDERQELAKGDSGEDFLCQSSPKKGYVRPGEGESRKAVSGVKTPF